MKNKTRTNAQIHRRASVVTITFPHASLQMPTEVSFLEEDVVTVDGVESVLDGTAGRAWDIFTPERAGETFKLYDMISEEEIEGATATYGQLATLLYSLYFHVSEITDERDARIQEELLNPPTDPDFVPPEDAI